MDARIADPAGPQAVPIRFTTLLALGLGYFGAVFAAGFVLGVARTLALEPAFGPLWAVAMELPLMLAWAWWVCSRLLRRHPGLSTGAAVALGALAFGCLMVAEAALSLGLGGRSLAGHLALYREPSHALGLAGQLLFAAWPLVQVWRRPALARCGSAAGR
mgnify:CR=1 FL=1